METISSGLAFYHFQIMSNELASPRVLVCPADKSRKPATNFITLRNGNVSYFVGLEATDTNPNMFLAGDDNLLVNGMPPTNRLITLLTNTPIAWSNARHARQGNVALADGSVQQFSPSRLAEALANTGSITNRILLP